MPGVGQGFRPGDLGMGGLGSVRSPWEQAAGGVNRGETCTPAAGHGNQERVWLQSASTRSPKPASLAGPPGPGWEHGALPRAPACGPSIGSTRPMTGGSANRCSGLSGLLPVSQELEKADFTTDFTDEKTEAIIG